MFLLIALGITQLIYILIALIVIAIIAYIIKVILDHIPAPPFVRTIAYLVLFLIVLLVALSYFGVIT